MQVLGLADLHQPVDEHGPADWRDFPLLLQEILIYLKVSFNVQEVAFNFLLVSVFDSGSPPSLLDGPVELHVLLVGGLLEAEVLEAVGVEFQQTRSVDFGGVAEMHWVYN